MKTRIARRNPWPVVGMAALALVVALLSGGVVYWNSANQLAPYVRPPVALPRPNAYDDYVAAAAMCRAVGGSGMSYSERQVPPGRLRTVVARNRAALARLRQGFGKQSCAPPVVSLQQVLTEVAGFWELPRVLVAEGKLAERQGRRADAVRCYRECLRFGVDVPRGGVLFHGFKGLAIQSVGLRALEESVDRLDSPTAANVGREMWALDRKVTSFADTLTGEKEAVRPGLMDAFRHGTAWDVAFPDDPPLFRAWIGLLLLYGFPSKRTVLANYRSYMDAGIADAWKPYNANASLPARPHDPVNERLTPDFSLLKAKWLERDARWRIMELRLAARSYQLRHGSPAPSAETLVPGYLPAVPRDPFADRPLVYRVKRGRVIVYSRGPDGKDDGGKDLGDRVYPGMNGDIVTLKPRRM